MGGTSAAARAAEPERENRNVARAKRVLDAVAAKPLVKSRQRVQDHAEVLTPAWLVDDMLNLIEEESSRIDSRFLEPACGDGNFLVRVLARKLATVRSRYAKSPFELGHQALLALMSIYGIEIQPDNASECRRNLLNVFAAFLGLKAGDDFLEAARSVLEINIIEGDALAMSRPDGQPIIFAEWGYLGRGRYQRRDFRFDALADRSEGATAHEVFSPVFAHKPVTVKDLRA